MINFQEWSKFYSIYSISTLKEIRIFLNKYSLLQIAVQKTKFKCTLIILFPFSMTKFEGSVVQLLQSNLLLFKQEISPTKDSSKVATAKVEGLKWTTLLQVLSYQIPLYLKTMTSIWSLRSLELAAQYQSISTSSTRTRLLRKNSSTN